MKSLVGDDYFSDPENALKNALEFEKSMTSKIWNYLSTLTLKDMPENYHIDFRNEFNNRVKLRNMRIKNKMFKFNKASIQVAVMESMLVNEIFTMLKECDLNIDDTILKDWIKEFEKETDDYQEIVDKVMSRYYL